MHGSAWKRVCVSWNLALEQWEWVGERCCVIQLSVKTAGECKLDKREGTATGRACIRCVGKETEVLCISCTFCFKEGYAFVSSTCDCYGRSYGSVVKHMLGVEKLLNSILSIFRCSWNKKSLSETLVSPLPVTIENSSLAG